MMTIRQRAGVSIAAAALVGTLTSVLGATHAVGAEHHDHHHAGATSATAYVERQAGPSLPANTPTSAHH